MTIQHARLPAREEFPLAEKVLYLNASLQQPLSRSVQSACSAFLEEHLGNPTPKGEWTVQVERLRGKMAKFIGATPGSIAITKNTSDGLNHYIHARHAQWPKNSNVVVLDGEHPNQIYAWKSLERQGLEVRRVPQVNFANAETFAPAVDENTRAIGVSWVMFHSGQRNDIEDICRAYRARGVDVLVDATQGVGVLELDVGKVKPSALAFSCHKGLGTPAGLGILHVDPEIAETLKPLYLGPSGVTDCPPTLIAADSIDNLKPGCGRFEMGNLNYIALHGAEAYLDLIERVGGIAAIEDYLYSLSQRMIDGVAALGVGTVAPIKRTQRSSHNVVLKLQDQGWIEHLTKNGCLVSHYRDGMRVSLGIYNNEQDIDRFVALIAEGLSSGIPAE